MKTNKQKKGISLIVLVITIIVMIILAATIILSLSSSGIIGRANEAKVESDTANQKQAATVALAEYELAKQNGELEEGQTATSYVQSKLKEQNLEWEDVAVTKDGEVLTGLNDVAIKFVDAGVEIGDTVEGYLLNEDEERMEYTTSGNENKLLVSGIETDPQPATITRDENIKWRYFGINEKGEAQIVGSSTADSPQMSLGGKGGYLNGITELNTVCEWMYSSNMGKARSINMNDVIRILEYNGERASYYDAEGNYVPLKEEYTVEKILNDNKIEGFTNVSTPDGTDIYSYKSNYFVIGKTDDENEYNSKFSNLIFVGHASVNPTLTRTYWIASNYACVELDYKYVGFYIAAVNRSEIIGMNTFLSENKAISLASAIRPVVTLDNKVKIDSYENNIVNIGIE